MMKTCEHNLIFQIVFLLIAFILRAFESSPLKGNSDNLNIMSPNVASRDHGMNERVESIR
jgi:hypothetical protein